jgi:hypothetical protein
LFRGFIAGGGVGEVLCNAADCQIEAPGYECVWLDCIVGNHPARQYYEHHGWLVSQTENLLNETPEGICQVAERRMKNSLRAA